MFPGEWFFCYVKVVCRIHDSVSLLSMTDLWYLLSELSVPANSAVQRHFREYKYTSTICYDRNY